MDKKTNARAKFSGQLGFVLATAGSSVGLGNLWRFPGLAAKYGGGIFLLCYIVLVVTFGYVMVNTETVLGRMAQKGPVGTFRRLGGSRVYAAGGWLNALVSILITPYYSLVGGWVIGYLFEYLKGNGGRLVADGCFGAFITDSVRMEIFMGLFIAASFLLVLGGVKNGIERVGKVLMPLLVLLTVGIMVYTLMQPGAMEGVKFLLIPKFENFSAMTVVAAMGQMFYSLSIALGVLYTYGSYLKKDVSIPGSTEQVEVFDTAIALMASLIIIPTVFAFSGGDPATLKSGPSLMFITLPKVFGDGMGGNVLGAMFFFLVFFAALTSVISMVECSVSTLQDELGMKRGAACAVLGVFTFALGSLNALGFGVLEGVKIAGMGIFDFFDFVTGTLMMPVAALMTCMLALFKVGMDRMTEELAQGGRFSRKGMYVFFMKYLCVACTLIVFLSSVANALGWITI